MPQTKTPGLNEQQARAVDAPVGQPILCLAGAGSGKTRVLIERTVRLLEKGTPANRILAITFARKAAEEMRARIVERRPGVSMDELRIQTFHSLGLDLLKDLQGDMELDGRLTVSSESAYLRRISRILEATDSPLLEESGSRDVGAAIGAIKMMLPKVILEEGRASPWNPYREPSRELIQNLWKMGVYDITPPSAIIDVFHLYQQELRLEGIVDYQDLISLPTLLLGSNTEILRQVRGRWDHVLVDEYQDTDACQEQLLQFLSSEHRCLFVVGDDDQSIFGFRNADIHHIRSFHTRHDGAHVVALEDNYRSTPEILRAANEAANLQANRPQPKSLRPNVGSGRPPELWSSPSDETEANRIGRFLSRLRNSGDPSANDAMILVRLNSLIPAVERGLQRARVPYSTPGRQSTLDRPEIRDVLAYLRLAANWRDTDAFRRIANRPARGLTRRTVELILEASAKHQLDPIRLSRNPVLLTKLSDRQKASAAAFAEIIRNISATDRTAGLQDAFRICLESSGLLRYHSNELAKAEIRGDPDQIKRCRERNRRLQEFALWMEEFRPTASHGRLSDFINLLTTSIQTPAPEADQTDTLPVRIMTIHAAKGLQASLVIVVGLEEGTLPAISIDSAQEELDEEARLLYVAMTRAEQRLILSTSRARRDTQGATFPMAPSPFLRPLEPHVRRRMF